MEEVKKLIEQVQILEKWCKQASKAETRKEIDEARVEGLKTYQETLRQVNRAYHDLRTITNERYAYLAQQSLHNARKLATEKPADNVQSEIEPAKKTTEKKSKPKKAKK